MPNMLRIVFYVWITLLSQAKAFFKPKYSKEFHTLVAMNTMRLFATVRGSVVPVHTHTQSFVDTEDFIQQMLRYVEPCGAVNSMYVDFENTKVPVSHVSEIRVLAHLAAAYHNACLAQRLGADKDLYGNPYTPNAWPEPSTLELNNPGGNSRIASGISAPASHIQTTTSKQRQHTVQGAWDEEMTGDRTVFDPAFQINEDLVSWLTNPDAWEDKSEVGHVPLDVRNG